MSITTPRRHCSTNHCASIWERSATCPGTNWSLHDIKSFAPWHSFSAPKTNFTAWFIKPAPVRRCPVRRALHCRIITSSAQSHFILISGFRPLLQRKEQGMATTDVALHEANRPVEPKRVVNNMSIQVATVNGSGSQSSNTVLLRSIFQMGVPVSGKNLFPSNIAGLPTWYTIRANKDGYVARKKEIDFLVAMNAETAQEDVMSLAPGAAALYDEPLG